MERTTVTKEYLADISRRLVDVAVNMGRQVGGRMVTLRQRFFIDLLRRQIILLRDIERVLTDNVENRQQSAMILARCLLDDFIILLYMRIHDFEEEILICHTAEAYKKRYKMLEESMRINDKYFKGVQNGLVNRPMFEKEWFLFAREQSNEIFFKVVKPQPRPDDLKSFPSTASIIRNLPVSQLAAANANAFVLWKQFSGYVHYSSITSLGDRAPQVRAMEFIHLKEVFNYTYKSFFTISEALNMLDVPNKLSDPTEVFEELMKY